MRASLIAPLVQFLCYDTTELTELTFGCKQHDKHYTHNYFHILIVPHTSGSKPDSVKFTGHYLRSITNSYDPFQQFDEQGVGKLLESAVARAKDANKSITQCVISDTHGCDAKSAFFFQKIGINVISCKPEKVALAKLVTAQTNINIVANRCVIYHRSTPSTYPALTLIF